MRIGISNDPCGPSLPPTGSRNRPYVGPKLRGRMVCLANRTASRFLRRAPQTAHAAARSIRDKRAPTGSLTRQRNRDSSSCSQQHGLYRRPPRPERQLALILLRRCTLQVRQYLRNELRLLDAGDDLQLATAARAALDLYTEARLRGVENIREFIASAAVTLVLDLPFLLIFVAIMFAYNASLTVMALGIIAVIVVLSLLVAPIFRSRLNDQFLLGARNQAFTTEYIAGLETVKSLQMEPQVKARYNDNLADYLRSGFTVRQIANTYNVLANGLEQAMGLLILIVGATYVMNGSTFTIGMLVAFQMFASRVSQPMLRLVGLWQQFQQASLSVARLGDIMNAPTEPYS